MENQLTFTLEPYSLGDDPKPAFTDTPSKNLVSQVFEAANFNDKDFATAVLTFASSWTDEAGTFIGIRINYYPGGNGFPVAKGSDIITMRAWPNVKFTDFLPRIKNAVEAYKRAFSKA